MHGQTYVDRTKPRANLIKLFGVHLLTIFCKLDYFANVTIVFLYCEKI